MLLVTNEIFSGTYIVRVGMNEECSRGETCGLYQTVCIINRISRDLCEITPCLGMANNELIMMLSLKCIELGFTNMNFCIWKGEKAAEQATYLRTENGMDYYCTNLEEVAKLS